MLVSSAATHTFSDVRGFEADSDGNIFTNLVKLLGSFNSGHMLIWLASLLLTFTSELERIWARPKNWFTVYWLLARYIPIIFKLVSLQVYFRRDWTVLGCRQFSVFNSLNVNFLILLVHLSFLLRLYALYARSLVVLVIPTLVWCAQFALMVVLAIDSVRSPNPLHDGGFCLPLLNMTLLTATIGLTLAFDIVVMILVLARCIWLYRNNADKDLLHLILRDGLGYFGVITLINILNTVGLHAKLSQTISQTMLMLSTVLPVIIVTRMILQLRAAAVTGTQLTSMASIYSELSAPRTFFSSIVNELFDAPVQYRRQTWREFPRRLV